METSRPAFPLTAKTIGSVVWAAGQVLPEKSRHDKNGNEPARVPDHGKDDRRREDRQLLPEPVLGEVPIDGGEHRDRHQGANTAATFIDLKLKGVVGCIHHRAEGADMNTDEVANGAGRSGLDKLQTYGRLREKIKRHHEKQKGDGK